MVELQFKIGDAVKGKGGKVGIVVAIDEKTLRAQVVCGGIGNWVSFNSLELSSIPYKFTSGSNKSRYTKHRRFGE